METDSLSARMKRYESAFSYTFSPRQPLIIRADGKSFHSLLADLKKELKTPFSFKVGIAMDTAAVSMLMTIQNARFAYVQSDEISVLVLDYNTFATQPWFGGNVQKIASVSASAATAGFNSASLLTGGLWQPAMFDARAFILPEREVVNYFVYRQQDATRNAIQMVGQHYFSHNQLLNKSCDEIQEMLWQKNEVNFGKDFSPYWRRGRIIRPKNFEPEEVPIFTQDRAFIEQFMLIEEE